MSDAQLSTAGVAPTPGKPEPLGSTLTAHGVQFAFFSRRATAAWLLLFDRPEDSEPAQVIVFDPRKNRTGDIWHVLIPSARAGQLYLFRVDGPYDPNRGLRFNSRKVLLDPYAKAITHCHVWHVPENYGYELPPAEPGGKGAGTGGNSDSRREPVHPGPDSDLVISQQPNVGSMPKCIVVDNDLFDWQDDRPLNYPLRFSVIYEGHVRGLSADPSAGVAHPGTYRGVIEMIPYLKELGITSLELLPVQEFDEFENAHRNPDTGERLENYWGYGTIAFFAPKGGYAASGSGGEQVSEFKEMVRALHKAGIELILDVVFNHTGEGNHLGPTVSFRGLDNRVYYILEDDRRMYKNFSGCGNTLNCNHPVVHSFILDCLHYWVTEMHVDGFRFDLGSILGRDEKGHLMENPPILLRIAEDPILRNTKIIAEAWDAAGAYQVGGFPGGRWAEWNDQYRDDVRRFWRGDPNAVSGLATRITGSSDLYLRDGRKPFHSINFITSHDGFTLNDLVSYEKKQNLANGEQNSDGMNDNLSANYGAEGRTDDQQIEAVRNRQIKNFFATLFLSLGTPMFLSGDEIRRTQMGNNNAYCQNNSISFCDYSNRTRHGDIYRFCQELIRFRLTHPAFLRPEFYNGGDNDYNAIPDITWYNENGKPVDWDRPEGVLALRIDGSKAETRADQDDYDFYMMFNATSESLLFAVVPITRGKQWCRVMDTSREPPDDFLDTKQMTPLSESVYTVASRSMVLLAAFPDEVELRR